MKKFFFTFAVAVLALASCSNDETTAVNNSSGEISFRPLNNGITRATEKSAFATNDQINVWCTKGSTSPSSYFDNATFTYNGGSYAGFASATPYYWPTAVDASTNMMTFYATFNESQTSAGNISAFTPNASAASQVDLLCAKLDCTSKPATGEAQLAFKHALSEIIVQAKNSNSNLKITVSKVKVGYIAKTGALVFTSGSPVWSNTNPTSTVTDIYSQDLSSELVLTSSAQSLTGTEPWMILPQNLALSQTAPAMVYTKAYQNTTTGTAASDANLNCAYIALELLFQDATTNESVVSKQWCYWPITNTWTAGHKYTYVIDAAQGGYQPTNVDAAAATDLDAVLNNLEIRFNTSTTIEAWYTESDINVGM